MSKPVLYFRVIFMSKILYAGEEPFVTREEAAKKFSEIVTKLLEQGTPLDLLNQALRLEITEVSG